MKNFVYTSIAGFAALSVMTATAEARHEIITPQFISVESQLESAGSFTFVFDSAVPADLVHDIANRIADQAGVHVLRIYADAVRGFSANMSAADAARLASEIAVIEYYESNGHSAHHASNVQQTP